MYFVPRTKLRKNIGLSLYEVLQFSEIFLKNIVMQVVYMFESIKNCLDSIIKAIESRQWFASLCMCRRNV